MLDWNDLRYFLAVARGGSTLAAGRDAAGQPDHGRAAHRRARAGARLPVVRPPPGRLQPDRRGRGTARAGQGGRGQRRTPSPKPPAPIRATPAGRSASPARRSTRKALLAPHAARASRTPSRHHDRDRFAAQPCATSARARPTSRFAAAPRTQPAGLVGRRICDRRLDALLQPRLCRAQRRCRRASRSLRSHPIVGGGGGNLWRHYQLWLQRDGPRGPGRDAPRDLDRAARRRSARGSGSRCCPASSPTPTRTSSAASRRDPATGASCGC